MSTAVLGIIAVVAGVALCPDSRVPQAPGVGVAPVTEHVAERYAPAASLTDTTRVRLAIKGMTCGSCAATARIVLERVAGVYQAKVSYDSASAEVRYDSARTSPAVIIARLEQMTGYIARVVADPAKPAARIESP